MSAPTRRRGGGTLLPMVLAALALASAVAVVQVKQHNRELTTQLDQLRQEHAALQLEWAQLQLEQATLAQHGRIDALARAKPFDMVDPQGYQIVQDPAGAAQ